MRRPLTATAGILAAILLAILLAAWLLRFRLASHFVERRMAAAQVPASYRITQIGPFLERIEDVRIGDPAAPDLTARRIDIALGYGLGGATIRAVHAEGVRVRGRIDASGFSLGTLDRLLPKSQGRPALPDLDLSFRDVAMALATPNGAIALSLDGTGNPQRRFQGDATVSAPALRLGWCAMTNVSSRLRLTAESGRPSAQGPARISGLTCPTLQLGTGGAAITLSADRTFESLAAHAVLGGFDGSAGPIRFANIQGPVAAAGKFGDLTLAGRIRLAEVSMPGAAAMLTQAKIAVAGTPFGPTVTRAADAAARLSAHADVETDFVAAVKGYRIDLNVRKLTVTGRDNARVTIVSHGGGGLGWTEAGLRMDADVEATGGGLPAVAIQLRQDHPGAALSGVARLTPYRVGVSRLASDPIRFRWADNRLRFDTRLTVDGPVGDGYVRGLTLPLRGIARSDGAFAIDDGCQTFGFAQLNLSGFTFAGGSLPICGGPLVARGARGPVRITASTGPLRIDGRTRDGTPLVLKAGAFRYVGQNITAQQIDVRLGDPVAGTHLAIGTLDGRIDGPSPRGTFKDAAGSIVNVALDFDQLAGTWRYDGALRLNGALRVRDAVDPARINPLVANDTNLTLDGGIVTATGTLREPASQAVIARVDLTHNLAQGTGHAGLAVDGITFTPKGLQPDKLTPLTLGVIANVAGTVTGHGDIDWGADGTHSSGTFATDRIDLAAAFGPATGISGTLVLTDLVGLVSAPHQEAKIAEVNPGIIVDNGVLHYQLPGHNQVAVESAEWPLAGGTLRLDPTTLDFGVDAKRYLTFRVDGIDAAAFIQQLDFPNISATGTFDGVLPMVFDQSGGQIIGGKIAARNGGTVAYVGELSNEDLGAMGKMAFDALKAIRYSALDISLDGRLDGEMLSRVRMTGIREATGDQSIATRLISGLPFRFAIDVRAPFRALVGTARTYADPRALLQQGIQPTPIQPTGIQPSGVQPTGGPPKGGQPKTVQPPASETMR